MTISASYGAVISASSSITIDRETVLVRCTPPIGGMTVTLPPATVNNGSLHYVSVKRVSGGLGACNVTPVEGGSVNIDTNGQAIILVADGTTWQIIGQHDPGLL